MYVMCTYMYVLCICYMLVYMQLVPLGLFELHCDEIVRSLAKRAEAICQQLLTRMAQENQKLNQE